jgi:hypothetical protein
MKYTVSVVLFDRKVITVIGTIGFALAALAVNAKESFSSWLMKGETEA